MATEGGVNVDLFKIAPEKTYTDFSQQEAKQSNSQRVNSAKTWNACDTEKFSINQRPASKKFN